MVTNIGLPFMFLIEEIQISSSPRRPTNIKFTLTSNVVPQRIQGLIFTIFLYFTKQLQNFDHIHMLHFIITNLNAKNIIHCRVKNSIKEQI